MTQRLPFTKANLRKRIDAAREAGLDVSGILTDGTLLTADSRPVTNAYLGKSSAELATENAS